MKYRVYIQDTLICADLPDMEWPWEECNTSMAWDGFEDIDEALVCASVEMFEEHIGNKIYRTVRIQDEDGKVIQEDSNHPTKRYE